MQLRFAFHVLLTLALPVSAQAINFVVLMTDDQRLDMLEVMPLTIGRIADQGLAFDNAYISTPVCNPARASFMAGGREAYETGVLNNHAVDRPNGAYEIFNDTSTIATALHQAGWATGLVGKPVNRSVDVAPRIPPGWTLYSPDLTGSKVLQGSSAESPTAGTSVGGFPAKAVRTPEVRDLALDFIRDHSSEPFFLWVNFVPPHHPATPLPQDEDLFPSFLYRGPAYHEADMSDKSSFIQVHGTPWSNFFNSVEEQDEFHRDQLRSLQGVDRAVAAIVDELETLGIDGETYIFFTSDNGYLWGEHWMWKKGTVYEEAAKVPLLVRGPGIFPGVRDQLVSVNLDVPATILALAGATLETDGIDLGPILASAGAAGREHLLLTLWPLISGVRWHTAQEDWKYVDYAEGGAELYDLQSDPHELESRHDDPAASGVRDALAAWLAAHRPLQLTSTANLPTPYVGTPYQLTMTAHGGTPPYRWALHSGELPKGLSIDPSGVVSGVPLRDELTTALLQVTDSSWGSHSERPQRWIEDFHIKARLDASGDDHDGVDAGIDVCPEAYDPNQEDADGDGVGDLCDLVCSNGLDDDGDGLADLADPGCANSADTSERGSDACDDGSDNDGDLLADAPQDPGCDGPADGSERGPAWPCDDDVDGDGDGLVDFPIDSGCPAVYTPSEAPACNNWIDDDGDGRIDFADSHCTRTRVGTERARRSCGLGFEAGLAVAACGLLRRRRCQR